MHLQGSSSACGFSSSISLAPLLLDILNIWALGGVFVAFFQLEEKFKV